MKGDAGFIEHSSSTSASGVFHQTLLQAAFSSLHLSSLVLGVCTGLRGHTYISVPFSMRMEVSGRKSEVLPWAP